MPEGNEELIEHEVVIDKYITATIKIPKRLTAMELAALMAKAKKMFNISDAQEQQQFAAPKKNTSEYVKVDVTNEQEREILDNYNKDLSIEKKDAMAKKYGVANRQKLYSKYQNLRRKYNLVGTKIQKGDHRKSKTWTEKKLTKLKKMYKDGRSPSEIGLELELPSRRISNKVYALKLKGDIK